MKRSSRVEVEVGLHLRVEVHGPEKAASAVVLVHGFMGSAASWGDLPQRLSADRRVVVPELPGHGGSDRPTAPSMYRVPRIARMLQRVAVAVDADDADWLGYSMGGRIVLAGAAEGVLSPRSLILESTSPGLETEALRAARRTADEALAGRLEQGRLERFVDDWLQLPLFSSLALLPDAVRERERRLRLSNDPVALAAALRGGGTGMQRSYWSALAALSCPSLLLTGDEDRKFSALADRMSAMMPDARRGRIAGVGHAVHVESPSAWQDAVERSLSLSG